MINGFIDPVIVIFTNSILQLICRLYVNIVIRDKFVNVLLNI